MIDSLASIEADLEPDQRAILRAVKSHCERLLDHTPRFRYFTLHGEAHLNGLFGILRIFLNGGVKLNNEQLFILSLSICIHDLGMVVPLREKEIREILDGRPGFPDAAALENFVRERHHDLLDLYFEKHLDFLVDLGVSPTQIAQVRDVSRCHRKIALHEQNGMVKTLGSLLRVIDELDIGSARAPTDVFLSISNEMDSTSCWHWFKHNITESWSEGHNVDFIDKNGQKRIAFSIIVHPTRKRSIEYWLRQIKRPISKALFSDGAQQIIQNAFNIIIEVDTDPRLSNINVLGKTWEDLEERSLSSNQKVILVIDDERRKLEDLFLSLMGDYHVVFASDAKDAITKLRAGKVDLAVVDMQIGAGGIWDDKETQDFKVTGLKICDEIKKHFPGTKVGILTGTRYQLPEPKRSELSFFLRKPVDPSELTEKIKNALR